MQYVECSESAMAYLCSCDEKLKAVIERMGRIQRPRTESLFEALVGSFVSQQISIKAADAIWKRLEAASGIDPHRLATMEEEELRTLGLSGRKAQYVKGAAKAVVDGTLDLHALEPMSDSKVKQRLCALYGVGEWTAEMLMIFSLGRPDVLSERDLGIVRGIKRVYDLQEVTPAFVSDLKKTVSPFGTAASLYLWAVAGEKQAIANDIRSSPLSD